MTSIIIPTYKRSECVVALIECLKRQTDLDFELIVVDQLETPNAALLAYFQDNSLPFVYRYFRISQKGRSLAKNFGIDKSKGDFIIFCDDDIEVPDNFVETHIRTLEIKKVDAASCRLVEEGDPSLPIKKPLAITFYGKLINKPYSTLSSPVTSLNGGNMSFRKEALEEVGFFEEDFIGTSMVEEPDIAYRLLRRNYKIYFNSEITVKHFPQFNGNIAIMKENRIKWFHDFFVNLLFFYTKYGSWWRIPFVMFYCLLVVLKHSATNGMNFGLVPRSLQGLLSGFKMGLRHYRNNTHSISYTAFKSKDHLQIVQSISNE